MTVRELIVKLLDYNMDAEIKINVETFFINVYTATEREKDNEKDKSI